MFRREGDKEIPEPFADEVCLVTCNGIGFVSLLFNPLNPRIKIEILNCCPYSFPTEVVGRSWYDSKQILCDHVLNSHEKG